MVSVHLVCGVAAAGKSWLCRQLTDKFHYLPHDQCWKNQNGVTGLQLKSDAWPKGAASIHVAEVVKAAQTATKPVITECPFAEREVRQQIEAFNIKVLPYFVVEPPHVVGRRYRARERKDCPKNVLTRAATIKDRAKEWGAPAGTSEEILAILRTV